MRQSRLHSGLAQVFLVLFALLAGFAPVFDVPSGIDSAAHVSSPADLRSDAVAGLIGASLESDEEFEDNEDQDGLAALALATFGNVVDAPVRAGETWPVSFPRFSAHFGTGPPAL